MTEGTRKFPAPIFKEESILARNYRKMGWHPSHAGTAMSEFAANFCEKWGSVAAIPDGEDSSGRCKLRLQTPEELVARAMETTRLLYSAMLDAEWLVPVPEVSQDVQDD